VQSIRERRGEKVTILAPLFKDIHTNMEAQVTEQEPYPGQIYMDSMAFGMGNSCLQVTFEAQNINHARYLHDQLLPFTPLFAALSAAGPIYKGMLSDIDLRWNIISQSVDCRTKEERDPKSENYIAKSRYSTSNHYLSSHEYVKDHHNDAQKLRVNSEIMEKLK